MSLSSTTAGHCEVHAGPDSIQFDLPDWFTPEEVADVRRHVEALMAAHVVVRRVAAAITSRMAAAGVHADDVARVLGIEADEVEELLGGAAPGFTVAQLGVVAALVEVDVSALLRAVDEGQDHDVRPDLRGYVTRDECIEREIIAPLGEHAGDHDVPAIA